MSLSKRYAFDLLIAVLISGCAVYEHTIDERYEDNNLYDEVMVKKSNQFLFVDLRKYLGKDTRSFQGEDEMVSLESLLDRESSEVLLYEDKRITQIPFKDNVTEKVVMLSNAEHQEVIQDSLTIVKIFLVEIADTLTGEVKREVATMIPDVHCMKVNQESEISFLDKATFSGLIIYSYIDGTFDDIYVYGHGPIAVASIVSEKPSQESRHMFLGFLGEICTKADYEELEASICIAERGNLISIPTENEDNPDPDWENENEFPNPPENGGGGGLNDPVRKTMSLSAAEGGSANGSGEYPYNSFVTAKALPELGYTFSRWVGDLKMKPGRYTFQITSDVVSTVYFKQFLDVSQDIPCYNDSTGKANPLIEMLLAPSNDWDRSYHGSTFGMTRISSITKEPKLHSGIDLYAEPGTPIFAMYDGVISTKEKYITEQPMRIGKDKYPEGYKGDRNSAGNRFSIDCNVDGHNVSISYWHLSDVTPVAKNPRTGKPFRPGDKVYRGELVGYTGRTGNAYNVSYPHLHLTVKTMRGYVNPEHYLNGSVQDTIINGSRRIYSRQITGIKCDDEGIEELYRIDSYNE